MLILFGGNSSEHEVSCKSCKSILENIDRELFDFEAVGIDFYNKWYKFEGDLKHLENGKWKESKISEIVNICNYLSKFDVVFPLIHGYGGEDGKLQGLLDFMGVKYVGSDCLSSAIGMDKAMSKIFFESLGIPQVEYVVLENSIKTEINIEYPLVVKPANGGSSIGISKVSNDFELDMAIKEARKYDNKVIIEKYILARELECAVLEKDGKLVISNPGEIITSNDIYDFDAKYENNDSSTNIPQDLPLDIVKTVKNYSYNIFKKLSCRNLARIDFFLGEDHKIYINEINTIPGFTKNSMYPTLIASENINYRELITVLINEAFSR